MLCVRPSNLGFNKASWWFQSPLKFENHGCVAALPPATLHQSPFPESASRSLVSIPSLLGFLLPALFPLLCLYFLGSAQTLPYTDVTSASNARPPNCCGVEIHFWGLRSQGTSSERLSQITQTKVAWVSLHRITVLYGFHCTYRALTTIRMSFTCSFVNCLSPPTKI